MCGRILMLLLFAINAHNILWVLGAVEEDKVTKQLNRMELDQYMHVLELKSMIYKILQANDKIADRLEKVERMEGTLELVKMQVQDYAFHIKPITMCERWLQTQKLDRSTFLSADGKYFCFNKTELDWNGARDWCAERGMQLAILKTQSQIDAVAKELLKRNANSNFFWLGASDVGQTAGQFRWADGTLVDGNTWRKGKIYKYHGNLNERTCVELFTGNARLTDERCSNKQLILCQVPAALAACL